MLCRTARTGRRCEHPRTDPSEWRSHRRWRLSKKRTIRLYLDPVEGHDRVSTPSSAKVISDALSDDGVNTGSPVALERIRSFTERASWRTVNQVTVMKMMKMMREIKGIAKKLPSKKWTGD